MGDVVVDTDGATCGGEFWQVEMIALKDAEVRDGAKLGAWYADGAGGGDKLGAFG